jgi:monoterpene epsilon-lactone hydrolase
LGILNPFQSFVMTAIPAFASWHALAPADQETTSALRALTAPMKGKLNGPAARPAFAGIMQRRPAVTGVTYEEATVGGVPGWWCHPAANRDPASAGLFLHGGCFVMGSAQAFCPFVSQLVARTGLDFFVPDYRLAPEQPFPAAPDDALAAYRGLVAQGRQRLVLAGDSAGGNLVLVTLAQLAHAAGQPEAAPSPCAAVVFSPMTDLALTSASMQTQAEADPIFTKDALAAFVQHYLHGHAPHDELASPLYGELAGLPPLLVHVGTEEVLRDDSLRYAERAHAAGGLTDLHVWEGMPHGFAASADTLLAARLALDLSGAFLTQHLW